MEEYLERRVNFELEECPLPSSKILAFMKDPISHCADLELRERIGSTKQPMENLKYLKPKNFIHKLPIRRPFKNHEAKLITRLPSRGNYDFSCDLIFNRFDCDDQKTILMQCSQKSMVVHNSETDSFYYSTVPDSRGLCVLFHPGLTSLHCLVKSRTRLLRFP